MNDSKLAQIADILPPTAPVTHSVDIWFYILLFTSILAIIIFWKLRSRKQQLRRLRNQYQQQKINNRRCAFQLKKLLQLNSSHQNISTTTFQLQKNSRNWCEYSSALQAACYSRKGLDDKAMSHLLSESEQWL